MSVDVCFDKYFYVSQKKNVSSLHCTNWTKKIIILYDLVMSKVGLASDFLMIPLNIDTIYN